MHNRVRWHLPAFECDFKENGRIKSNCRCCLLVHTEIITYSDKDNNVEWNFIYFNIKLNTYFQCSVFTAAPWHISASRVCLIEAQHVWHEILVNDSTCSWMSFVNSPYARSRNSSAGLTVGYVAPPSCATYALHSITFYVGNFIESHTLLSFSVFIWILFIVYEVRCVCVMAHRVTLIAIFLLHLSIAIFCKIISMWHSTELCCC